jgi:hypothetical protein
VNPLLILELGIAAAAGALFMLLFVKPKQTATVKEVEKMATGFVGWLQKVGADAEKGVKVALEKVLPDVVKVAQLAEPVVDLALPAEGPVYNLVVNALATSAQGFAALGQGATADQLASAALTQTESTLLPALEKAGLAGAQATAVATAYINAIQTILNGPLSGASSGSGTATTTAASGAATGAAPAAAPALKPSIVAVPSPAGSTVEASSPGAAIPAAAQNGPGLANVVPQ